MEIWHALVYVCVSVIYFGCWIENCYGLENSTDYESSTDVFYTEIVTELVTEIDDFVTSENTTVTPKYRAGLWIAIAVVCIAAIVVVFLLLASVVLRWRRAEESSYNLERSENDHTNPAFEAGEIAGLEPANGMHEVSIGLTTFADEESKSVL
ncbi:uncharacterized protein [Apostichopus japonicus]|uniref:uncharacterized protein isoform X2 n=1 Tax=Stichopus japonicus TaxID=307972 RepID=UPI003AB15BA1